MQRPEEALQRQITSPGISRRKVGEMTDAMVDQLERVESTHVKEDIGYIFARSKEVGQCWEWQGCKNASGYGKYHSKVFSSTTYAHRAVASAFLGNVDGKVVCHRCDNPSCIRPDHLFIGSAKDNHDDCVSKGRDTKPPKVDWIPRVTQGTHHLQKLRVDDVRKIRGLLSEGVSHGKIAKIFGVGSKAISKIATGERWWHVS